MCASVSERCRSLTCSYQNSMLCLFSGAIETKPFSFAVNNFNIIFIVGTRTRAHSLGMDRHRVVSPAQKHITCVKQRTRIKTDAHPKISHRMLVHRDKTNMFQINYDLPFRILWWSASFDGDGVGRGRDVGCYYLLRLWTGVEIYCIVENKYNPNTQPDHIWTAFGVSFSGDDALPNRLFKANHRTFFSLDIFICIS